MTDQKKMISPDSFQMTLGDRLLFLRSWLRNPSQVGAIAPSGRALTRLMTARITAADSPVIELGPGTGAFTRALLARGIPEHRLALVEADPAFARTLKYQFPTARHLPMDAAHLGQMDALFHAEPAGAVISGLPLLSIPLHKATAILEAAFSHHLRTDGTFYQFTYGPRFPLPAWVLEHLGLQARRVGFALVNMPPAAVYCIQRRVGS